MEQFSIRVGNTSDFSQQTQCAYHYNRVARSGSITLNCNAVGQYVSLRREGGQEIHLVTICEFVVMGHPARTEGEHDRTQLCKFACTIYANFPIRMFGRKDWCLLLAM